MAEVLLLKSTVGPLAGGSWVVTEAGLRLGREPQNDVHIPDTNISRQHARVVLYKGAVWVQDAGSRNGVFVNGERVADQRQVAAGDKVAVGAHLFEIAAEEGPPPAAPPPPPAAPAVVDRSVRLQRWWPVFLIGGLVLGALACAGMLGVAGGGAP
jgi:predicted component of type VI protein secretion system